MSAGSLIPKNGAISLSGYAMDFASFSIRSAQSVENVTGYNANTMSTNAGSGTADWSISIGGFAQAHATGTPLGLPTLSAVGVTTTLTLDTGVTESGLLIIESIEVGHRRMGAAVPVGVQGKNGRTDWVETWATT